MNALSEVVTSIARKIREHSPSVADSVDLWGKSITVNRNKALPSNVARELVRVAARSIGGARQAVLALNSVYLGLIESDHVGTHDRHIQQDRHYVAVLEAFRASGLVVEDYAVDAEAFERFLQNSLPAYKKNGDYLSHQGGLEGYFPQKAFEHWISAEYLAWKTTDRVLDFAVWISPATAVLAAHRPAAFYRHDITFKTDLAARTLSGFSDAIESPSDYFDVIMAHCAIDNFEGDFDTHFFREAARILKPGGRLLITPLHMASRFENRVALGSKGISIDDGAAVVLGPPGSLRFARLYDVAAVRRRITDVSPALDFKVIHVTGLPLPKYPPTCTNRFMLLATKR